jgi:hypothetical protein
MVALRVLRCAPQRLRSPPPAPVTAEDGAGPWLQAAAALSADHPLVAQLRASANELGLPDGAADAEGEPAGGGEASCESSAVLCGRVLAELIECVADRERLLHLARRVLHALCCAVLSIPELVRVVAAGGECSVLPARRSAVHQHAG